MAVSAYRSRAVADAKIAEDLKKAGPAWESFQQNRYDELHRSLAVVVNNAGTISMMSTLVPETGQPDPATVFDTLKREQASSARADFLIATTPQGTGLARTDRPLPYSADLSGVPTIAGAMQGAQTEGIWLSGGKLYHVVAAPVLEGGTRLVGVIAAAFQINDEVARNLEQLLNTQVVFLADAAKASEPAKAALAASTMGPAERGRGRARSSAATTSSRRSCAGQDDRPARPRRLRRDLPRVPAADPLLHRSDRRRRRRDAQPREGARAVPADPEHADPRGPRRAGLRVHPLLLPGAADHRAGRPARPGDRGRSASATSTRRTFPSSPRTRSASSRARSGRCSRSFGRRPRSSSTSPRSR